MGGNTSIPKGNDERVIWSLNFEDKFPALGASLGFNPAAIAGLLNDSETMRFLIQNGVSATAHSKATNSYKYAMLEGVEDGASEPVLPILVATAAPATTVLSGIIDRLSKAIARMKTSPGYTESIGDQLLINPPPTDSAIPPGTKPVGIWTALPNNVIRIDWTKGKFDGVIVEGQRGDETEWTRLDRDTRSPFDDQRPNQNAGKPEERRYRLLYFLGDDAVGTYSDVIVAVTTA